MRLVRLIHRAVGIAVAVPLAITALSGTLLLARDPWYRHAFPALALPVAGHDVARQAAVLDNAATTFSPAQPRVIKFPRPGFNGYHIYLTDRSEALVDPSTGAVLDRWRWHQRGMPFLFEMHAHLLSGETGKTINGVAAVLGVLLAVSGVMAWWSRRSGHPLAGLWPRKLTNGAMLRSHASTGLLVTVPLLLFAATGAGIVFYPSVSAVIRAAFDSTPAVEPSAHVEPRDERARPWRDILRAANSAFPGNSPAMAYPSTDANAIVTFRYRLPGEWHPNGRSYVLVDPYSAAVIQAIDARQQGAGTRAMYALYPLHAANVGWGVLTLAGGVTGVVCVWLAVSGSLTYLRRARRKAPPYPRTVTDVKGSPPLTSPDYR